MTAEYNSALRLRVDSNAATKERLRFFDFRKASWRLAIRNCNSFPVARAQARR